LRSLSLERESESDSDSDDEPESELDDEALDDEESLLESEEESESDIERDLQGYKQRVRFGHELGEQTDLLAFFLLGEESLSLPFPSLDRSFSRASRILFAVPIL